MTNKYKTTLKEFITFLKQNNAFLSYRTNLYLNKNVQDFFTIPIEKFMISGLLTRAFIWEDTKEGVKFWRNLNMQWINLIRRGLC